MAGTIAGMSINLSRRMALSLLLFCACSPVWGAAPVQPVVNQDYLPVLLELIAGATHSIEFLQLEYHDDLTALRIDAALAEAVKRGVRVRGLLDDGIDFNADGLKRLLEMGAEARLDTPRKMLHSKLVVVDDKKVLLGSTNWTGNSMDNNNETNVLLDDPVLAGLFGRYFAALWTDSFAEPDLPSAESGTVKTIVNRQYFPEVLSLFDTATQRIRVIMYGINYNPKYRNSKVNRLVEALAAARDRGVEVAVVMDLSNYNAKLNEINTPAKEYLAAAGVAVYDDDENITTHAKMILADNRVVIGSANWGYDAIERRNETCVVIHDPDIAAWFADYFDRPGMSATPFPGGKSGG